MIKNAYIHIPFCRQKCNYCSFVSFPNLSRKTDYIEALIKEIKYYYKNEPLNTLYFGGGTPSLLSINEFDKILTLFNLNNTEITVEINPETVDRDYLSELYKLGVNRISLGCQTFEEETLKLIGRKHSSAQVKECIKNAQETGFENINLDLIYGLPNQTIEDFEHDLATATNLGIQHISLYGLKIEQGCYFYNHMPVNLPDSDTQADMYIKAIEILTEQNFKHYEISNFAHSGFESKHNLNYWDNHPYYGFGVSAHGYTGQIRYSNKLLLNEYIRNPILHESETQLTQAEQLEEEIFLGFRKTDGINTQNINRKYSIDFEAKYKKILDKYTSSKHLIKTSKGYKLSTQGILLSNFILSDFLQD